MNSGTRTLDAAAVLASARRARATSNAAEAQVLADAVEWARLHEVDDLDEAATWLVERGRDTGIPIAGEGAPLVSEFAVAEFASALGLTAESGRNLIAQAMELAYRLPRLWARVTAGQLAPWRARRIAEETLQLSFEAATFVDQQLAPFAHRTGLAQTQRTVEEAIARFMPEFARERRERAADGRYFSIEHDQVSFAGTSRIHGELDLADALDLEDAVAAGAAELAAFGNEESLDVRRSLAVGMLARGEQPLAFGTSGVSTSSITGTASTTSARAREMVLYVHLSEDAIRTGDPNTPVRVENAGGHLLTAGQIADWCGNPTGSTTGPKITVKPVIDLHQRLATDGYEVPARIAEHVELRDKTCVFPYCNRPARRCDKDHIVPWDEGGETATDNLACLCRLHHRLKTHAGWTYSMIEPGVFLWRSPYGYTYLRDHTGTSDLTPKPVEPPVDPPPRRTS